MLKRYGKQVGISVDRFGPSPAVLLLRTRSGRPSVAVVRRLAPAHPPARRPPQTRSIRVRILRRFRNGWAMPTSARHGYTTIESAMLRDIVRRSEDAYDVVLGEPFSGGPLHRLSGKLLINA